MKKGRLVLLLLVIGAVVMGANRFARQVDQWRFPWGYASSGRPTLTGSWVGTLRTAGGQSYGVLLALELPDIVRERRSYRRGRYGALEGTARTCDTTGGIRSYTVYGAPETRDATRIQLGSTPVEQPQTEGTTLSTMQGTWDQATTLHVETHFIYYKNGGAVSGPEHPETQKAAPLHMSRGGDAEFSAACARVKQPG